MKLTTEIARFSETDSEEVQINIDRYGLFSAKVPRRIVETCKSPNEISAKTIDEIRQKIKDLIAKYRDYQNPPRKVLAYSFSFASTLNGYSSKSKFISESVCGFAYSHAILKTDDLYLCDDMFLEISNYREDRNRPYFYYIDYSEKMAETFKKIETGIKDIQKMLKEISLSGFDMSMNNILLAPKQSEDQVEKEQ